MSPLSGVRVVELARILAGPWIGQTLADLGADVIKVESPEGDDTRRWGPPFIDTEGERTAAYFHACNRGKRAIVADFATERGPRDRAPPRGARGRADRELQGRRPEEVRPRRRDAERRSIRGSSTARSPASARRGPTPSRAGYDFLIQGMSGFMDITGEPDGPPQKAGVAISDLFTGLYGVIAIEAALIAAASAPGAASMIDLALLDTTAAMLANQAMNFLASGVVAAPNGQRASQSRALPDVSSRRRLDHRRGRQRRAVRAGFARVLGLDALAGDARYRDRTRRESRTARRCERALARRRGSGSATLCSRLSKRPSCPRGRSTPSQTSSPIRNSSPAACASRRRGRRACAARS